VPLKRKVRSKETDEEKAQKNFALNKISHHEAKKNYSSNVQVVDIGQLKLMRPTGRNFSVQVSSEIEA